MIRRPGVLILLLLAAAGVALSQAPVVITTPSTLPNGYVGLTYGPPPDFQGLQFTDVTQPSQATTTWSILTSTGSNPPPGIGISSSGFMSGVPTTAGDYTFLVGASTQYGKTTGTFTMHVTTPQVTIISTSPLPGGIVNQQYNFSFTGTATPPLGITWFADPASLPPGLFLSNAGLLTGTPTSFGTYTFTVSARLTGTEVVTNGTFSITIYAGRVSIITTSLPLASIGQTYSTQLIASPQGVIWSLAGSSLPPGFNFDVETGILSGGGSVTGIYKFAVQAAYPNYISASATYTLYVTNGPLGILETSLPIAIQNARYSTTLTPQGGLPPFTWALGRTNPLGFTIDASTGTISGTPTVAPGTSYPLTVVLSDTTGTQVTVPYSVFVAAPLSVATTALPNGVVGVAYTQALAAAGGQAPYTWLLPPTSGPLPPGLSMGSDGIIRGTPTTNGVYPIIVQVTDFGKRIASANLSLTIGANVTLTISPASLPDGQPGVPYSVQLTAAATGSGAQAPFTFTTDPKTLPLGLSLSPAGLLSGTPVGPPQAPLGTSTFTVTVKDSSSASAPLTGQKTYTLNITLPLGFGTNPLPNGVIGTPYPQASIQPSGGDPPYNITVTPATAFPAGLTLNPSTGAITGTPTGPAGVSTFTINLQDSGGQKVQKQFTITITAPPSPPSITTGNLSGTVGTPFSATLLASGGTSIYTFALTAGTPPAGLTFTPSNATLSGTPTAAGSTNLTFTVTDTQQQVASKTITVTITLPTAPPATIGAIPANPAQQPNVSLSLGNSFPADITGILSLSFQSAAGGSPSEVQFVTAAGGSQSVPFTIPAGSLVAPNVPIATGTVAGTITITAKLTAGGVDVTPNPPPTQTIVIKPAAPVIQSVTFSNTGGTVTVTVIGYSTTREVSSGDFVFSVSTGNTVSNGGDVVVTLGSAFTTWYQSAASNPFGGQFKLTVPFNVANGTSSQVTSVTVKLTNSVGTSAAVSPQ